LAENRNNADVKTNTIIIVNQTDVLNTVKNLSTLEIGLGQGTNHLIAHEMYGMDGSVIPESNIGSRGTMPATTSAIPVINCGASLKPVSNESFSEG
jgi:hypothetical protein